MRPSIAVPTAIHGPTACIQLYVFSFIVLPKYLAWAEGIEPSSQGFGDPYHIQLRPSPYAIL
jgi:hypothetical protein